MPKVFISYSRKNSEIAQQVAANLKRDGAEVFIDYAELSPGQSLPGRISDALDWCDTLVLLWSQHAKKSKWVRAEWENVYELDRKLILCLLDDAERPAILRRDIYIEFSELGLGYPELARALKLKVQETAPKPEIQKPPEKQQQKPAATPPAPEVPKPRPIFLGTPQPLSVDEVKSMLKKQNLFDKSWNEKATGFANDFELNKNGQVVYDRASGLMWQQAGSPNYMTYEKAKEYIPN